MDKGLNVEHDYVTGWWKDTGTPKDILHANQLILESMKDEQNDGIFIGKNCTIEPGSKIISPVIIDENSIIKSSTIIGPNVSIGKNSYLQKCTIKNSIIMNDCKIDASVQIVDSIIADGTEIKKNTSNESVYLLGERSQVNF
jgi:glucose-1-phosphate thymidylyltransferase